MLINSLSFFFFSACQHLNSETNLRWVRGSERLLCFALIDVRCFVVPPGGTRTIGLRLVHPLETWAVLAADNACSLLLPTSASVMSLGVIRSWFLSVGSIWVILFQAVKRIPKDASRNRTNISQPVTKSLLLFLYRSSLYMSLLQSDWLAYNVNSWV
jgi:hypothetical protein